MSGPVTITSHDVARLAGVSQPTVSRALRGDPRVAETTRLKVAQAATELGYVPSELGRSLSTRLTRQVAMVADLSNALYPALVEPLHDRFAEHGLRMVLLAERGDDRAAYDRLLDRSVDGVVLTTTMIGSSLSKGLLDKGVPFVELNRLSGRRKADGITADNNGGARTPADRGNLWQPAGKYVPRPGGRVPVRAGRGRCRAARAPGDARRVRLRQR
jgi:LacI family transcriptional regulator